jgi:hypothetical protein
MIERYKKHILLISLFKLIILVLLPLTGDEAYFIKWADNLNIGYYDHPPMVGWIIYIMQYISDDYIIFRLFSFFTVFIISYLIYKILLEFDIDKEKAIFPALLFFIMPIDILILLFTNDIPLLLFGTVGTYFLLRSFKSNLYINSILAGLFLGLSFLSKYFAVFLMFGLLIYIIYKYKEKSIKNIIIVISIILLFIVQNLYFNYNSCWNNIMFNFFARTDNLHYNIGTFIGYISILVYLLTPWGIYYIYKSRKNINNKSLYIFILSVISIGLLVFLSVSFKKKIGLHWLLLYMPYLIMLFIFIEDKYKNDILKYNLVFTYIHIFILIVILLIPIKLFENSKKYKSIILFTNTSEICNSLDSFDNIYTTGYTSASILSYHCNKNIKMIMNNSKYGRLDDKLVDIRELENKTMYIFNKNIPNIERLNKIFEDVTIEKIKILNKLFYISKCKNLKYKEYKKYYLDIQKEKFYNIPSWLPIGDCYFKDRYYK